jgi:signal transduction histidine kinase/DNA-binding response OmpR family regulator
MSLHDLYSHVISGTDRFIDRLLSHQDLDAESLQFKRTYGLTGIVVIFYVAVMEGVVIHFEIGPLILYGALLEAWYIPLFVAFFLLPYSMKWLVHLSQHVAMFLTFYTIVRLGGIPYCGGTIFAGLMSVIVSPLFRSVGWSIYYFLLFVAGCILVDLLPQWLNIAPYMEPRVNRIMFLINALGISGMILREVLVFLRQYAEREKERADRLRELDEVKTKFYTNITHEFRTPLTLILGRADQIEAEPEQNLEQGIQGIRRHSRDLLHLVNQMLDLSRLESGMDTVRMVRGDVTGYLKVILESFHVQAAERGLSLEFESDPGESLMDYDQEKLKQIVYNLLSNAVKYTRGPGKVTLRISQMQGSEYVIQVEDTGPGIPEGKLDKVFERFYSVDNQTLKGRSGSGLGLSITRELVKLLGGSIEISSKEQKGTVVTVRLPVTQQAPELRPEESVQQVETTLLPQDNGRPVVLVVEDHPEVSEYLGSLLSGDYTVHCASDGKEGMERATELVPDLIVSDVMMPVMDGFRMLEQLKRDVRTSHIPVIFLTARADVASRLEGLEVGADAYLEKPFNKEELFIRIRKLLEGREKLRKRYASMVIPELHQLKQYEREDAFISRIQEAMKANLSDEEFGVGDLCRILGMSRSQLYRKFRALTHVGIRNYLINFRLHMAKQLLRESDLSVTQIAYEVGFRNLSHFIQRFQMENGVSPGHFRSHPN